MTGFATDVDLLVVGIELICFGVVAFFDVSTVTLCAAGIPIKIDEFDVGSALQGLGPNQADLDGWGSYGCCLCVHR